jgi:L-rhamnose isomerase
MLRLTTQSWEIGDQAARTRAFAGTLDEIRVYDRVLDPSEIAALSAACPP